MKTGLPTLLFAYSLLATATAAPTASSTYKFTIRGGGPKLNGSTVVLKDESAGSVFPNPLGSFSTGEPRNPFTFTVASVSTQEQLYELQSTVRKTHLVLNGNPIAPQLFEAPIGGDPAADPPKTITRTKFLFSSDAEGMSVRVAEEKKDAGGEYDGSGSWRACNGTTIDYQLYWYDGLSNLNALRGDCESLRLILEEVKPSSSSSASPTTTSCSTGFITGVPAPTMTASGFTTKVSTSTSVPTPVPTNPASKSEVTIRIYNDQTGKNAEAIVSADATAYEISKIFRTTAIDSNGDIIGTSAQLTKFTDSTKCTLKNVNVRDWALELDGRAKNFVDLDGNVSKAIPVWLNGFTLQCRQA